MRHTFPQRLVQLYTQNVIATICIMAYVVATGDRAGKEDRMDPRVGYHGPALTKAV